jgi:Trypsin
MKRVIALVTVAVATLALAAGFALAQTGDAVPDGNGHPNVGALLMPRADGSLRIICSGTLVTPRVFLTASHCTAFEEANGFTRSYVTFDANFGTDPNHDIFSTPYVGEIVTNPAYKPPYHSDASLILLDEPVSGISPAQIAALGLLDELKRAHELNDLAYTNVGYGTSEQVVIKGAGPTFPFDGIRKITVSGYHALDQQFIHLDQNLARGLSGAGYGDSGGPTFIDTARGPVVISVVSSGDVPLYSTSVNTRADTDAVQDFLAPYLALH